MKPQRPACTATGRWPELCVLPRQLMVIALTSGTRVFSLTGNERPNFVALNALAVKIAEQSILILGPSEANIHQ
jgi:hypothetical protein